MAEKDERTSFLNTQMPMEAVLRTLFVVFSLGGGLWGISWTLNTRLTNIESNQAQQAKQLGEIQTSLVSAAETAATAVKVNDKQEAFLQDLNGRFENFRHRMERMVCLYRPQYCQREP